jgi:hypothetical protein
MVRGDGASIRICRAARALAALPIAESRATAPCLAPPQPSAELSATQDLSLDPAEQRERLNAGPG